MEAALEGPRSCPPKAHLSNLAQHSPSSGYAGARSAEALDMSSLPGGDSHSRISKTSRFLEEVRVRLFADTPIAKKRGERSPLITKAAVSSQDPYVSSSMPKASIKAERVGIFNDVPQSQPSSPAMDMPYALDTQKAPSARIATEKLGADLHSFSSRDPSVSTSSTSSKANDKENVPAKHTNIPRIPRASMGGKLDFSFPTSGSAADSTPSMSACELSPSFSPMQIDTHPPAHVPPVPSFLKRHAQSSMGTGTAEQPQDSVGADQGSDMPPSGSPQAPSVPSVLSSSMTALQHMAGRAVQEAAALHGADEATASQVRACLAKSPPPFCRSTVAVHLFFCRSVLK